MKKYLDAGRNMLASLQDAARCTCGYCHISDVEFHQQEDHMESFFLAETVKYLWLLFDLAAGPDNLVENGPYKYIFSTERHFLPMTRQISLVGENCSYLCRNSNLIHETYTSEILMDTNYTESYGGTDIPSFSPHPSFQKPPASGLIKGFCPGLMHGQRYGISYIALDADHVRESSSSELVALSPIVLVKNQSSDSPQSDVDGDPDTLGEPEEDQRVLHLETVTPQANETQKEATSD